MIRPEVKSEPARPQVIPESPQEMITEVAIAVGKVNGWLAISYLLQGSSDTITTGLPGKEESPKEEQDLTVAPQDAAKAEVAPQSTEAATEGEAAPCSIDERIPHEVTPAPLEGEAAQEEDKVCIMEEIWACSQLACLQCYLLSLLYLGRG